MAWYYYIAIVAIFSQLVFLGQMCRNYRYALAKYKRDRSWYRPRTVLIVPCKGLDAAFDENITSFFNQDYENYLLWFVVADQADPAYKQLCKLKDLLSQTSKAHDIQILLAGQSQRLSMAGLGRVGQLLPIPVDRHGLLRRSTEERDSDGDRCRATEHGCTLVGRDSDFEFLAGASVERHRERST